MNKVSKSTHIKQSISLNSVTFLAYETYECVTGLCYSKLINSQNVSSDDVPRIKGQGRKFHFL